MTCRASADRYGAFVTNTQTNMAGTDGMWLSNTTSATQTTYLFIDQFTGSDVAAEPTYILWVEYK